MARAYRYVVEDFQVDRVDVPPIDKLTKDLHNFKFDIVQRDVTLQSSMQATCMGYTIATDAHPRRMPKVFVFLRCMIIIMTAQQKTTPRHHGIDHRG